MKTASTILSLACALICVVCTNTLAQEWETYPQGALNAWGIAVDPAGTTAYAVSDNMTRRGDAGGTLWSDASLPEVPAGYRWLGNGNLAVGPTGDVYLAGGFWNLSDNSRTFNLFESNDGAVSWRSVFEVSYVSPRPPSEGGIGGVATDASGNIYVANVYFPGTPGSWAGTLDYYRVRKGITDPMTGQVTWTVLDDYPGSGQLSHGVGSLAIRPEQHPAHPAEIWVAGSGIDAKTFKNSFPFVRRSLDGGVTWATVSSWPVPRGYSYSSGGIVAGADVNGLAYVTVGYRKKANGTLRSDWLIYRSLDHGATWKLVDVFPSASEPSSFAADALGGVFIAGNGFVRASVDGGNTWVSPDLPGANCVAADLVGDVFVGGSDAIYKLPAPVSP